MSSMSDLNTLLSTEIPEGLQSLTDSNVNLARVAEYCESNYFQVKYLLKLQIINLSEGGINFRSLNFPV